MMTSRAERAQGGTSVSATNKIVRMQERKEKCVAANEVIALLRDKWTILVLGALTRVDSLRYNELQRSVDGISQRMLTLTLRTLEANGLVKRTSLPTIPPRVDYELTAVGRSLVTPLRGLLAWAMQNRAAMEDARRAYTRKMA
jgi:DNA-binding HxlR family transcriptional regulator